jgi:hypothetical protein
MILIFNKKKTGHFLTRICIVTDRLVMTKLAKSWQKETLDSLTVLNRVLSPYIKSRRRNLL